MNDLLFAAKVFRAQIFLTALRERRREKWKRKQMLSKVVFQAESNASLLRQGHDLPKASKA